MATSCPFVSSVELSQECLCVVLLMWLHAFVRSVLLMSMLHGPNTLHPHLLASCLQFEVVMYKSALNRHVPRLCVDMFLIPAG